MKTLNRRTWAIMIVVFNPHIRARLPRITAEAVRFGLISPQASDLDREAVIWSAVAEEEAR